MAAPIIRAMQRRVKAGVGTPHDLASVETLTIALEMMLSGDDDETDDEVGQARTAHSAAAFQ